MVVWRDVRLCGAGVMSAGYDVVLVVGQGGEWRCCCLYRRH